jgi:hypothetical protein
MNFVVYSFPPEPEQSPSRTIKNTGVVFAFISLVLKELALDY